jgi:hypothetical protein
VHVAQLNVGRILAPPGSPIVQEFMDNLDRVNAIADESPGFVWRLQTEDGNATAIHAWDDDPLMLLNMSVWASVEALADYVYRSVHVEFLRRRREWFERAVEPIHCLWWVEEGHIPTVAEAVERLEHLRAHGPTERSFTFRQARDTCPG